MVIPVTVSLKHCAHFYVFEVCPHLQKIASSSQMHCGKHISREKFPSFKSNGWAEKAKSSLFISNQSSRCAIIFSGKQDTKIEWCYPARIHCSLETLLLNVLDWKSAAMRVATRITLSNKASGVSDLHKTLTLTGLGKYQVNASVSSEEGRGSLCRQICSWLFSTSQAFLVIYILVLHTHPLP